MSIVDDSLEVLQNFHHFVIQVIERNMKIYVDIKYFALIKIGLSASLVKPLVGISQLCIMIKLGCYFQRLVYFLISTGEGNCFCSVGCFFCHIGCFSKVLFGDILMFFTDTMIITNCLCNDCCGNGCSGCPCYSWVRLSGVNSCCPCPHHFWVRLGDAINLCKQQA